jgi:mannonate dehydratase
MEDNRRNFIKKGASLAAVLSMGGLGACTGSGPNTAGKKDDSAQSAKADAISQAQWPIDEGTDTPKLCIGISSNASEAEMRKVKQIGINHVLMGGGKMPWTESNLRATLDRFKKNGLTVINMMIGGFPNAIYGREGRDEEIKNLQASLQAAGAAGLPVVEYNFYADRLMEGYYKKDARGGATWTAFNYEGVQNLPPKPEIGKHTAEELWDNLTYFLKAVIPVAEKAGVRMALHPNDPPVPVSHGSDQIMATLADWKRLIEIVDSPSNGITFDCGVTREIGEDPVAVCRYFGSRDRINHSHYRNVIVETPRLKYSEVFLDEGQVNMFEVMKELVRLKYNHGLFPEHPRGLDNDIGKHVNGYPGGGGYTALTYNVGFAHAMKLAVLSLQGEKG